MPLVPCEACRRHLRANETECPFCRSKRARSSAIAAVAVGSALALIGCEQIAPAAKYGGPPPGYVAPPPGSDSTSVTVIPSDAALNAAPTDAAASAVVTSPRLDDSDAATRVTAPATKYGAPPPKKQNPPTL